MKLFNFLGFVEMLQESIKIFFKNGKVMTCFVIIIPAMFLYSSMYLSDIGSIQLSFIDLFFKQTSLPVTSLSTTYLFYKQTSLLVTSLFFVAFLIAHLISTSITIVGSSSTYCEKNVSNGEMAMMVLRSWKRLFVTGFYVSVFHEGYICLVSLLEPLTLNIFWHVLSLSTVLFSIYLSVVLTLGLVVCMLDESCYGFEAFGKAAKIIKGHKMHGFALSFISTVVVAICMSCIGLITFGESSSTVQIVIGLLVVSLICSVKILTIVGYTVLFHKCKKSHGEEEAAELQESPEYCKIQAFVNDNIP